MRMLQKAEGDWQGSKHDVKLLQMKVENTMKIQYSSSAKSRYGKNSWIAGRRNSEWCGSEKWKWKAILRPSSRRELTVFILDGGVKTGTENRKLN